VIIRAAAAITVLLGVLAAPAPPAQAGSLLLDRKVIGYSVQGRAIVAYHLGDPHSSRVAVVLGQMHGDEHAGVHVVRAFLTSTRRIAGLNLWVIGTMNPDGNAADTRQNAHHVDLNRNWPHLWVPLTGQYYSGPRALSEPETVAMRNFLRSLQPHYVVSLHQPLYGVDTTDGGALDPAFRHRLAQNLRLPEKAFRCWSTCHGNMTGWYTSRRYGVAITVEFGWHPTSAYLDLTAVSGIVHALGGHYTS
jgi:murein peptide amidase A